MNAANSDASTTKVNNVWGAVIGATLLVNIATFSGVLLLVIPAVMRGYLKYKGMPGPSSSEAAKGGRVFDIFLPAFAVGALVSTAVFLIFPEALMYIGGGHDDHGGHEGEDAHADHSDHGHRYLAEEGHDDHGDEEEGVVAAKFGCAILGGFLLPFVFSIFLHHTDEELSNNQPQEVVEGKVIEGSSASGGSAHDEQDCESCCLTGDNNTDAETGVVVIRAQPTEDANTTPGEEPVIKTVVNKKLAATILLGDGFHNFSDGLFIAAAFRSCSQKLAIGIMLVTLAHEIPQELADFVVLTQYAGLSAARALILNFVSGLSVLLGGVIFLAANPSDVATGVVLAMGGGIYINAAACETIPRVERAVKVRGDRILMLFSIILGTIPIGLILLDHKHCG